MGKPASRLTLRPTVIVDDRLEDDYEVMWSGLAVGRLYLTSHMPPPDARWSVTGSLYGHSATLATLGADLEDAKRLFREWWDALEPTLTPEDIAKARRVTAEIEERQRRWEAKRRRGS